MSLRRRKGIVPCLPFSLPLPPLLPPLRLAEKWLSRNLEPECPLPRSTVRLPILSRAGTKRATVQLAYAYLPYLRPAKRRGGRSFVVPGRPRDTVNINKRSQEAVSRSVDFIGSSRLSSFRFFFQQPAITPGCSFTRPPLARCSVSRNRSDESRGKYAPFFLRLGPSLSFFIALISSLDRAPKPLLVRGQVPPRIIRFNWRSVERNFFFPLLSNAHDSFDW